MHTTPLLLSLPPEPMVPFREPAFSVKPGITRLDSGKTVAPTVTLVTSDYSNAYTQKLLTLRDKRFFATNDNFDSIRLAVVRDLGALVQAEHPRLFTHVAHDRGGSVHNHLTDERLFYDGDGGIEYASGDFTSDAFDALGTMLQQDVAVVRMVQGRDELVAANVRLPSHWTPSEKIGMSFDAIHAPIPGMRQNGAAIIRGMINGPRGERFAFGIDADEAYTHTDRGQLTFVPITQLHLTYERQTWIGNQEHEYTIFFIHKGKRAFTALMQDELRAVAQWMRSMDAQTRTYKRLERADSIAAMVDAFADEREARR